MCGIVGVITKSAWGFSSIQTTNFTNMLYCDALRGFDSTGIFGVNKWGNVEWMKSKGMPIFILGNPKYKELVTEYQKTGQILIGHNRKATQGIVSDENAHPFVENNIILVHNGTISGHKAHADVEVDSHAICQLISKEGYKEAIKRIDGAFTLIWYDTNEKKLRVIRNDKRPMHILETSQAFYLSSEEDLAKWILNREWGSAITKTTDCKPGVCYSWNIHNTNKFEEEVVPLYETKPPVFIDYTNYQKMENLWYKKGSYDPENEYDYFGESEKEEVKSEESKKNTFPTPGKVYLVGEKVSFKLTNYYDTASQNYDGVLEGEVEGDKNAIVKSFFKDEDWIGFSEDGIISGIITSINSRKHPQRLWLDPASLTPTYTLKSFNDVVVDKDLWGKLPHKCTKCHDELDFHDIPQCIIKPKPIRKVVICPQCVEAILSKQANKPTKPNLHVVH